MLSTLLESLKTLATSKRALIALLVAGLDLYFFLGFDFGQHTACAGLEGEELQACGVTLAEKLATWVTAVGTVLIAGVSLSDTGKALSMPAGVDHKGRVETPVIHVQSVPSSLHAGSDPDALMKAFVKPLEDKKG